MDPNELNHLFDQMSPTPEQEEAILARLRASKQEGTRPMKQIKKTAVVLAAAALLLTACAFAVVSTLDPRLLSFFQRTPQDTELLADGVVEVNQSHTYENGWTVEVRQMLFDRFVTAILVDVTAPEGTELSASDAYYLDLWMEDTEIDNSLPEEPSSLDSSETGAFRIYGSRLLPDENSADPHYAFLCYQGPVVDAWEINSQPHSIRIIPSAMWSIGDAGDVVADLAAEGDTPWSCTMDLSPQDGGRDFPAGQRVSVVGEEVTITDLYISPISCVIRLTGPTDSPLLLSLNGLSSMEEKVCLNLEDGSTVPMYRSYTSSYNPDIGVGAFVLQNDQIIDPEQVVSITILDQTFPLGE